MVKKQFNLYLSHYNKSFYYYSSWDDVWICREGLNQVFKLNESEKIELVFSNKKINLESIRFFHFFNKPIIFIYELNKNFFITNSLSLYLDSNLVEMK